VEMRLIRLENLMNRRPLLVNTVLLKQNKHNVKHWLERYLRIVHIHFSLMKVSPVFAFAEMMSTKLWKFTGQPSIRLTPQKPPV
jgi:hypothetical protein